MEAAEYQTLARFEERYWWYRAVRELLLETVSSLRLGEGAKVLDAGCGSGRHLEELVLKARVSGYGLDASPHAAALWSGNGSLNGQAAGSPSLQGLSGRCVGSVDALPFEDKRFDAVVCIDVLQARQVEPQRAMCELVRVVRPGGAVVVMVPAHQWLLSKHDQAVHCVRRFERRGIRRLAGGAGLQVVRLFHAFSTFFPIIAAVRLLRKGAPASGRAPRSDLFNLPGWLNSTLLGVARLERTVLRRISAPFGTSIMLVGRKLPA